MQTGLAWLTGSLGSICLHPGTNKMSFRHAVFLTRARSLLLGSGEPKLEAKEAGLSVRSLWAGMQRGAFPQGVVRGLGGSDGWS